MLFLENYFKFFMENKKLLLTHIPVRDEFDIIHLRKSGHLEMEDVFDLNFEELPIRKDKPIIISGAMPIWLAFYVAEKIKNMGAKHRYMLDMSFDAISLESLFNNKKLIIRREFIDPYIKGNESRKVSITIALLGPPHRGKSVFVHRLHNLLQTRYPLFTSDEFYLIKGCPDGEGLWSGYIPEQRATALKFKNFSVGFTDEFINNVIHQIDTISRIKSLIFVDCGGKIDDKNKKLVQHCTHALFFYNNEDELKEWQDAFIHKDTNTKLLATIKSVLGSNNETICEKVEDYFSLQLVDLLRDNQDVQIPDDFLEFLVKG